MKKIYLLVIIVTLLSTGCVTPKVIEKKDVVKLEQVHVNKWFDSSTIYEVNVRQYTKEGTFAAFSRHLPRLQELGVEILWFMPVHPVSITKRKGSLGSYYAVSDFTATNPEFGTNEEFKELVIRCHELGMKVILDWVPNHTGWDNKWIFDNPEWYTQENGEIIHPKGTDWTDVADLNYDSMEMRDAMIESMAYWVRDIDIDGFRCDVAGSVPGEFWNDASKKLNDIKPLFMLAEDSSNFGLLKTAFDSNYNWSLLHFMESAADGSGNRANIKSNLRNSITKYPFGTFPMNFITNHDENSWSGTAFERFGEAKDMMTALTFIMPGMPLIYSGQEAGLNKQLLFFEKDEIDWSDLSHQVLLKKLIDIKKSNPSLYNGSAGGGIKFINSTNKTILTFIRDKDDNRVIFMGNLSKDEQEFDLREFKDSGSYTDIFSEETIELKAGSTLKLKGFDFRIFVKQK